MTDSGAGLSRSRIDAEQGGEISEEPWIASLGVMRSRAFKLHGLRGSNLDRQPSRFEDPRSTCECSAHC
jgi:hypothetical protein